jgi:hypothetical protein
VRLRRPLDRKNVQGCARAAMRRNEVDDIRKCDVVKLFRDFSRASVKIERFSVVQVPGEATVIKI